MKIIMKMHQVTHLSHSVCKTKMGSFQLLLIRLKDYPVLRDQDLLQLLIRPE